MKGKYVVISTLITIFLFVLLVYIEGKITGEDFKTQVLIVKQNVMIDKFEKLDPSMFELKKVPAFIATNAVSSFDEINSKYALDELYSGEVLRKEKIGDKNNTPLIEVQPNMRKLAIPINSLADGLAGQIGKGTFVDILFTNSPTSSEPNIKTETILQKVKVLGVTDSNGVLLDQSERKQVSAVILAVTPEQAHLLVNKERKGKFTLIGASENSITYKNIVVK